MKGSRARAVLTLALVFVAGAAAGIAGDRLDMIPRAAAATEAETPGGEAESAESQTVIEQFADVLGLSSGQRMEIDLLLDYYAASLKELRRGVQPQYRALMDSVRVEIEDVLDDGQRGEYRTLIEERYGTGGESPAAGSSDSNENQ
jgi:hypothetical protein